MRASELTSILAFVFLNAALPAVAVRFQNLLPVNSFITPTSTIPSSVTLRAAVMTKKVPIIYEVGEGENPDEEAKHMKAPIPRFPQYRGFLADVLRHLPEIAMDMDNTTLTLELTTAPDYSYGPTFELMANDCNATANPTTENIGNVTEAEALTYEECNQFDFVVGHYYPYPERTFRAPFTPPLLTTEATALQFVNRKSRQIATLQEATEKQAPVCILANTHYDTTTRFPNLVEVTCEGLYDCIARLKREECALFVEDRNQLRYKMVHDGELQLTREHFNEQFIAWPMNARLDPVLQQMLMRWIYQAKVLGVIDDLYDAYFNVLFCPAGTAGVDCTLPCNAATGASDRYGKCVCESTKWTGEDCSIEVEVDTMMIPSSLKSVSYVMVSINFLFAVACLLWLALNRDAPQVQVSQPAFLALVVLGCLISSLAIVAQREDTGDGPVPACMALPWLYSIGFCITFGTLFAKIRRIFKVFKAAASMQWVVVSPKETLIVVMGILSIDVVILTVWTLVDPLHWERTVLTADKYGETLTSEGHCTSDHWRVFAGLIGTFHFMLLIIASAMCYVARDIDNVFCEGKYVAIAIVSNLQIFVVALPVLIILGSDPATSFFVRSTVIWMNDLVVLALIFGSLMWSVQYGRVDIGGRDRMIRNLPPKTLIQFSMRRFKSARTCKASDAMPNTSAATKNSPLCASGKTRSTSSPKSSTGGPSSICIERLGNSCSSLPCQDGPNTEADNTCSSFRSLTNIEEASGDFAP